MKAFFPLALMVLAGCNSDHTQSTARDKPLERALIVGSAESPDPVLTRVMALEKSGVVEDVVVQESFPVKIRLRAPRKVIDELNAIPRSGELR